MFAARVFHPLRDGVFETDRAAFDAALMRWSDFLARQPGLDSFTVLLEDQGLLALSIWADAASFQAAVEHPDCAAAAEPLMAYFAAATQPEFPRVLHYRRP